MKSFGQIAYEAWSAVISQKGVLKAPLLAWNDLAPDVAYAWLMSANAVVDAYAPHKKAT